MIYAFSTVMMGLLWWGWVAYARPAIKPSVPAYWMDRSDRLLRAAGATTFVFIPIMFTAFTISLVFHIRSTATTSAGIWPAGLIAVFIWLSLCGGLVLLIAAGIVQTIDRHQMRARNRGLHVLTPPPPWWTWAVVIMTLTIPTVVGAWVSTRLFRSWYADLQFEASSIRTTDQVETLRRHVYGLLREYLIWTGAIAVFTVVLAIALGIRQRRRRRQYFIRVNKAVAASASLEVLV